MPTLNEAQVDEGQVQIAAIEADVTGMTHEQIAEELDMDIYHVSSRLKKLTDMLNYQE